MGGLLSRKPEHLVLPRPFSRHVREAGHSHAVEEPTFDGGSDEIGARKASEIVWDGYTGAIPRTSRMMRKMGVRAVARDPLMKGDNCSSTAKYTRRTTDQQLPTRNFKHVIFVRLHHD